MVSDDYSMKGIKAQGSFPSRANGPGTGLAGRLLVSMPGLDDGPFSQSVVLICQHDTQEAWGVIVNKPISGLSAGDAISGVRLEPALTLSDAPVFFGGPCDTERGAVLHDDRYGGKATKVIGGGLALTSTRAALERLQGDQLRPDRSRLVAGHAGWGSGQLDEELRKNFWLDLEADSDLVLSTAPEAMWQAALDRIGINPASLSALTVAEEPSTQRLN